MSTTRSRAGGPLAALLCALVLMSALAITLQPAGAAGGAKVLAWGSEELGGNVKILLDGRGHHVHVTAGLPADLSEYDVIWYVGSSALTTSQHDALAAFVQSGKGVYLNGAAGASVDAFVRGVTGDPDVTSVPGGRSVISFASGARDGITVTPNVLGQMTSAFLLGHLEGVEGDNVFATNDRLVPVGGVWGPDDMVSGRGRVVMIVNELWVRFGLTLDTRADAMQNITEFLHNENAPPVVSAGTAHSGAEGSAVALQGSAVDPDGDPLSLHWSWAASPDADAGATCEFADSTALETTVVCSDDGVFTVTLTANDGVNPEVSASTTIDLANAPPVAALSSPVDGTALPANWDVVPHVSVTDPGANDVHTCTVDWGDGAVGPCDSAHAYAAPGLYAVTVTVVDDDGGEGHDSAGVAVYDPSAGFVTGGGVVGGPPGVPFSVAARYAKGDSVPTGHFRYGSFQATSFAWLVVDAAAGTAELAGVGSVDGEPGVPFRLSMTAGAGGAGSIDLRMEGAATVSGVQPVRGNLHVHGR